MFTARKLDENNLKVGVLSRKKQVFCLEEIVFYRQRVGRQIFHFMGQRVFVTLYLSFDCPGHPIIVLLSITTHFSRLGKNPCMLWLCVFNPLVSTSFSTNLPFRVFAFNVFSHYCSVLKTCCCALKLKEKKGNLNIFSFDFCFTF